MIRRFTAITLAALLAASPATARAGEDLAPPEGEDRALDTPGARDDYRVERVRLELRGGEPVAFVGDGTSPREGAELYLAVGRPDLAAKYRRRQWIHRGLWIGAGVTAVVGAVWFFVPDSNHCERFVHNENKECLEAESHEYTRAYTFGGLFLLGSALFALNAWKYRVHPIGDRALLELDDGYNRRLRRRLGVTDITLAPAPGGALVGVVGVF